MGIPTGKRDREIEIWRDVEGEENAFGERPITPTKIATLWAAKDRYGQAERLAAAQMTSSLSDKFTVLYDEVIEWDITTKDRVRYGGVDYNITSMREFGSRDQYDLFVAGVQV